MDESEHHKSLPRFLPELDHTSPNTFCVCLFFHSTSATFPEFSAVNAKWSQPLYFLVFYTSIQLEEVSPPHPHQEEKPLWLIRKHWLYQRQAGAIEYHPQLLSFQKPNSRGKFWFFHKQLAQQTTSVPLVSQTHNFITWAGTGCSANEVRVSKLDFIKRTSDRKGKSINWNFDCGRKKRRRKNNDSLASLQTPTTVFVCLGRRVGISKTRFSGEDMRRIGGLFAICRLHYREPTGRRSRKSIVQRCGGMNVRLCGDSEWAQRGAARLRVFASRTNVGWPRASHSGHVFNISY